MSQKRPRSGSLDDALPLFSTEVAPQGLLSDPDMFTFPTECMPPDVVSEPVSAAPPAPAAPLSPAPETHDFYVNFNDIDIPTHLQNKALIFRGYPLVMITCKGPVLAKIIGALKKYLAEEPLWMIFTENEIRIEATEKVASSCICITIPTVETKTEDQKGISMSIDHYACKSSELRLAFRAQDLHKALHGIGYEDLLTFKARDTSQLDIVVNKPTKGRVDYFPIITISEVYNNIVTECRKKVAEDPYRFKLPLGDLQDALESLITDTKDAEETLTFTGTLDSFVFSNDRDQNLTYEKNPVIGLTFLKDNKAESSGFRQRVGRYPFSLLNLCCRVMKIVNTQVSFTMGRKVLLMEQNMTEHWKCEYFLGSSREEEI